ncbi:MAG: efflux RND transporter permease subunit, partial [Sandaracinaceae bacterium]
MIGRLTELLVARPRLTLGLALLLSAAGLVSWFTMAREEDPRLTQRIGLLVVPFPGADAARVERLAVRPIEDELAEVDEVVETRATIRASVAVLNLELRRDVTDTDTAGDRVEEAIARARLEMPDGVWTPGRDHDRVETEAVRGAG